MNANAVPVVVVIALLAAPYAAGEQFAPPAVPAGAKSGVETVQGEILKVYALDEKGAKFRAYVVKYKGTEVIATDDVLTADKKVGDKVSFLAIRVDLPVGDKKLSMLQFRIKNSPRAKKP